MPTPDPAAAFPPETDWKLVAGRVFGMLLQRLTPQQIASLARIQHVHPTTRELACYLEVSEAQAGNITRALYQEGWLHREKAGKSYRWFPAFRFPFSVYRYHRDRMPIELSGEAAERAIEILTRRGKL